MRRFFLILMLLGIILMLPWAYISYQTSGRVYRDIDMIPEREYGVLLGTSPGVNGDNLFFRTRIEAAKELYERGKIHHILVSWDNGQADYNEPAMMQAALVKAGIPKEAITLDYAGFRTLDSVIRAREVFSITGGFTLISQPFHVERAIFLADAHGIDTIGYGAANVSLELWLYAYLREIPARWLAVYDVWSGTEATVLGTNR